MPFDPHKHHRHSIRLKDYDYSHAGAYFVTLVAWQRECLFGMIEASHFKSSPAGKIVEESWLWLAEQYDYVQLDEFCVMPNHFHGILIITNICRGGSRTAPTTTTAPTAKPLGRLIGAFKTVSAKQINLLREAPSAPVWQRNYYEHIIRNENEWKRIRTYIQENHYRWEEDIEFIG